MDTHAQSWRRACNGWKIAGISVKIPENRIELKWTRRCNQKAKSSGMQAMKQKAMQAKTAMAQKTTNVGMKGMQQKAKKSKNDKQEKNAMKAKVKRG